MSPGSDSGDTPGLDEERLRRLIEVGRSLVGESDTATVIESALTAARELTGARYAALGILDSRRAELDRFLALGIDQATRDEIGDPPHGRGVLGLLIEQPQPLMLEDVSRHPRSYGFPPNHPPMTSFLGVPVKIHGEAWGNLYLTEKESGPFDDSDEQSAVILAEWIALAISNARSAEAERVRLTIDAAEQERGRWARELHDDTLQNLAGLRVLLSGTRRKAKRREVASQIDQAIERVDETIVEMRRLIADLRPAALDELGVEPAITSLVERFMSETGVAIDLHVELGKDPGPVDGRLSPDLESTIYRLVQESLTNATRHGGATRSIVEVIGEGDQILVRVIDNGTGFNPVRPGGGFGLLGMRERVSLAGGTIEITSSESGTRIAATLPATPAAARDRPGTGTAG